ncbi:hypothetical protein B488_12150 [Liberibacter crescens BT-1]|uniref:Regulator of CtrA degradation n=1 Tax=Liberibacter crescens (strain BT-1) TaxID=1215343 RepID=L0EW71_LIBCB|nr:DUF1465 family protein [Liberibacter crescens]AGA65207.1 hypothetical protein B488_12150 [Liberibacter crescens BT-1]AMC13159.1 AraC family transcriptional regulator [Liberibacter crescens]
MSDHGFNAISFMSKGVTSIRLKVLYSEGMDLVEETSSYFDGDGRELAKKLSHEASVLYTSESIRLTTRLMQMASWLLLQRALNNKEMSFEQVLAEKKKVCFDLLKPNRCSPGWDDLPPIFKNLLERSLRLQKRIMLIDREIYHKSEMIVIANKKNNVREQIKLLETCFSKV